MHHHHFHHGEEDYKKNMWNGKFKKRIDPPKRYPGYREAEF